MGQHLFDLGEAALAGNTGHQPREVIWIAHPARGPALAGAAEIDELHVEAADRLHRLEHPGLEAERQIPGRLPAHGGVHGEHQPAVAGGRGRCQRLHPGDEGRDIGRRRGHGRLRPIAAGSRCRRLSRWWRGGLRRGACLVLFGHGRPPTHRRITTLSMWSRVGRVAMPLRLGQALGAEARQRGRRRQRLGIDGELDQRRFTRCESLLERRRKCLGPVNAGAEAAAGACKCGKIGVLEVGTADAAGVLALLMHPDGAIHAVVADDDDDRPSHAAPRS